MASQSVLVSQTLKSITDTKIRELESYRQAYNTQSTELLDSTKAAGNDVRQRATILLDGIRSLPGMKDPIFAADLDCFATWIEQSRYDEAISAARLEDLERQLRAYITQETDKLNLAHLYSRLLIQWIESPVGNDSSGDDDESTSTSSDEDNESFEVLQDAQKAQLEQLRDKFAKVVFEPFETDQAAIKTYLEGLFDGKEGQSALDEMREDIEDQGNQLRYWHSLRFDNHSLKWCIKALLKNSLLSEEKKASLKEFLRDDAVLQEIKDVLNMRWRDLEKWQWNCESGGMLVVPRQSPNGKWRVMVDEDILQSLLTHWIGTLWAVHFKDLAKCGRRRKEFWNRTDGLSEIDTARRQYWLGAGVCERPVDKLRHDSYELNFFMSPLPSDKFEEAGGYDADDDDEESKDKSKDGKSSKTSMKDVRQILLRTLATELIVQKSLFGEVAIIQSDLQWFATGMPHSTLFAVMQFLEFPDFWVDFFTKFLRPPLDMMNGDGPRPRQRGLPMAHIFEKLFGEMVLFFLDLAVAQKSGMILYRYHDDLWLVGPPEQCVKAWHTLKEFTAIMGLEINKSKTGSAYLVDGKKTRDAEVLRSLPDGPVVMDFLQLDADSGNWFINREHAQRHVKQLQKQLLATKSVMQWVQTWNSCIGRFFGYTLGEPAHCFGQAHLEKILDLHKNMHKLLFADSDGPGTGTLTTHLKTKIKKSFGIDDVPDAFFYLPEAYGGLGVTNPFVSLFLLRKNLCKDPAERMERFHREEKEEYERLKQRFQIQGERARRKAYAAAFLTEGDDASKPVLSWDSAQEFMSFAEFTKNRTLTSTQLSSAYQYFCDQEPRKTFSRRLGVGSYRDKDYELQWTLQLFEEDLMKRFGGIKMVDQSLLPLGVLKAMKERKITWQMAL